MGLILDLLVLLLNVIRSLMRVLNRLCGRAFYIVVSNSTWLDLSDRQNEAATVSVVGVAFERLNSSRRSDWLGFVFLSVIGLSNVCL